MKSYKELKEELLKDENFSKVYNKNKPLFNFLNSIIELRKANNISLRDLEKLTGIKYANLSRIENGKQNISYQTMWKLVNALNGQLYITSKGKNIVELSDDSIEKLKELVNREDIKTYIEKIIELIYHNRIDLYKIEKKFNYTFEESLSLVIQEGTSSMLGIFEKEFEKLGDNEWDKIEPNLLSA